ncbi:MAG: phospho-N-acetylmuramoyl-pentapeptide-transferase [Nitrospinae bacterium]|nr:phospho-N-acetylmuramoyl-pentapeptide-transferase [Nitrospinota bacterium]
MLYHLLYPLHDSHTLFNVFRYITFRSIYAVITGLAAALIIGPVLIEYLKTQNIGEKIRADGPKTHLSKAGTPTMGGIMILISLAFPTLLWADLTSGYIWAAVLTALLFGLIGFYDDYAKLTGLRKGGISGKRKLLLQFAAALVVVLILYVINGGAESFTRIHVPFLKSVRPDLGVFYIPFAMLVIVAAANAVNLTDGLDGLAIGPVTVSFLAFAALMYLSGNAKFAEYLNIPYVPQAGEMTVFCAAVVGASLGFLWYNCYPAMIFMGNVGSTALGGILGVVAVMCKQEILLAIVGGVFVVEALSVIIQVAWYKSTGKRFFRMAPLHHHFEQLGWPEPQVIVRFWIVSAILALISLSTLKLR